MLHARGEELEMRDRFRERLQRIWKGIGVEVGFEASVVGRIEDTYGETLGAGGEKGIQAYERIKMRLGPNHPAVNRFFHMLPAADRRTVIIRGLVASPKAR